MRNRLSAWNKQLTAESRRLKLMNDKIILLMEDDDAVLTLRTLKKNTVRNEVAIVRDGAEAPE